MNTKTERQADTERALYSLEQVRESLSAPTGLLIIGAKYGKGETDYFRIAIQRIDTYSGESFLDNLTWAFAKAFGYRLVDKNGQWHLAIHGGNFSKADELAQRLANFYGVARIRYEVL